ncbi:hypothetical protein [Streptomyces sp. NPDC001652]|uniref:hypothetical protein n=1 Tax=Streptomyces sp. NPDC001652 TaxID=3154393 RepID=UPI003322CBEC
MVACSPGLRWRPHRETAFGVCHYVLADLGYEFIATWDVARQLARARRILSVGPDARPSEEDDAEIESR